MGEVWGQEGVQPGGGHPGHGMKRTSGAEGIYNRGWGIGGSDGGWVVMGLGFRIGGNSIGVLKVPLSGLSTWVHYIFNILCLDHPLTIRQ